LLAQKLASSPHVDFRGILTHAGHSYACRNPAEIRKVAEQERGEMVGFASKLAQAGVDVREVSVGSTPTMSLVENLEGVTEARPGNYVFHDRFQAAIGSCDPSDTAFSILVTVIGAYSKRNQLLIDAGGLSFSKDAGPNHVDAECGYGTFYSADGNQTYPNLHLFSISQEVGKVAGKRPIDPDDFPIGTRFRIIPNHSCLAAALHDCYHVVRKGKVVDEWRPARGW
jgi:D-serine deaminase-like pyridoxal phosphate-dependent protein